MLTYFTSTFWLQSSSSLGTNFTLGLSIPVLIVRSLALQAFVLATNKSKTLPYATKGSVVSSLAPRVFK